MTVVVHRNEEQSRSEKHAGYEIKISSACFNGEVRIRSLGASAHVFKLNFFLIFIISSFQFHFSLKSLLV